MVQTVLILRHFAALMLSLKCALMPETVTFVAGRELRRNNMKMIKLKKGSYHVRPALNISESQHRLMKAYFQECSRLEVESIQA